MGSRNRRVDIIACVLKEGFSVREEYDRQPLHPNICFKIAKNVEISGSATAIYRVHRRHPPPEDYH